MFRWLVRVVLAVAGAVLLLAATCVSSVDVQPTPPPDDAPASVVPVSSLRVRFKNDSTRGVDVQFYVTAAPLGDVETVLFDPANEVTAGIGFVGSGLLDAGATDELTMSCVNAQAVGTRGGRFLDPEGREIGTGVQRVAALGPQYACGDTVTFVYRAQGDVFTTSLVVE